MHANAAMADFLGTPASLLVDVALKATLLLGAAALLTRLMHRRSAAGRHFVWSLAVGGSLLLPPLSALLPAFRIELLPALSLAPDPAPSWAPERATTPPPEPARRSAPEPARSEATASQVAPPPPIDAAPPAVSEAAPPVTTWVETPPHRWWRLVVLLWVVGAALALARLTVGTLLVRRAWRRAEPLRDPRWRSVVRQASRRLDLSGDVPLRVVHRATTPMVCGVIRPTVVVPSEALAWSTERCFVVALHELAHIKRHDALIEVIAQLAHSLFWFHPLMWVAARRMRLERERACDDCVLAARTAPSVYADHLLDIVRALGSSAHPSFAALAMARRSQFEGRLIAILDPRQARGGVPRRARALGATLATALIVPLSAVNPWLGAPDLAPPAETSPEWMPKGPEPMEPVAPLVVLDPAAVPAIPDTSSPAIATGSATFQCLEQKVSGSWTHTNFEEHGGDDSRMRVVMAQDGRCVEVLSRGKITFADDESDVMAISSGGSFSVMEAVGGTTRKLVIRPGRGGQLERQYTVNDTAREMDAEARAWLSRMLLDVIRETGYDADGRVKRLLAKGGAKAVLGEVERIRSSGAKARYLEALLGARELSPDTLVMVAVMVKDDVDSSGDKARLLSMIAEQPRADMPVRRGVMDAAASISSSGDRRRVLTSLVEESEDAASLVLAIRAGRGISSSGDKAALLLEIADKYVEHDTLRAEYLAAAATISSSGDRTRVLMALLDRAALSNAALADLLAVAGDIGSSGDKARLLTLVADGYSLGDARVRRAFFAAAGTIPSSGDLRRVLMATLARDGLADEELLEVIAASRKISSSSDRVAVLSELANTHGLSSERVRAEFMKAAESLASDSDYRRLMSTVTGQRTLQL
jgi:beta-lactamase regulating signal transducer with metallopeptidase domain